MCKYYVHMYVNGNRIPVIETVPGMGVEGNKGK
jgi:hypothetical protein